MGRWRIYLLGVERMLTPAGVPVNAPDIWWPLLGSLLALPDHSATRAILTNELWPEDGDDQSGRHRLGTAVWRLRRRIPAIESALASAGDRLTFQPGSDFWIDALSFERRAAPVLADRGRLVSPHERHRLRRALALYQGDFLFGREHDAILIHRERLRTLFIDAAYELGQAEAEAGEWIAARDTARRLCMVEPLREDGQRLLIEAHAACGSRGLAVRQYRVLEELLADELGVAPMPETRELAERVSGVGLRSDPPAPRPVEDRIRSWRMSFRDTLVATRDQISQAIELLDQHPPA